MMVTFKRLTYSKVKRLIKKMNKAYKKIPEEPLKRSLSNSYNR